MSHTSISPPARRRQAKGQGRCKLDVYKIITLFRRWFHIPDAGALIAVLGAYSANRLNGDPVWLLLVGPSSAGKSQMLTSLSRRLDVHVASTLTEASLLSGTPKKEKAKDACGGLLRVIGTSGVILLKDFTSTLSMPHEARTAALAALREVYDGEWTRHLGVDGGVKLSWKGKIGVIAGCTQAIDSHHAVMSAMGQRFLMYRMAKVDEQKVAMAALGQTSAEDEMRDELWEAVEEFFAADVQLVEPLSEADKEQISALAILAARCRSAVERDSRTREIELIPQPESPSRLAKQLSMLLMGIRAIGATEQDTWKVLRKIALDCMPPLRKRALMVLRKSGTELETAAIAEQVKHPLQTTRRALEDLKAHGVLDSRPAGEGRGSYWSVSEWGRSQLNAALRTVPEKSGTD